MGGGGMGEGKRETMYLSLQCHYQYQRRVYSLPCAEKMAKMGGKVNLAPSPGGQHVTPTAKFNTPDARVT